MTSLLGEAYTSSREAISVFEAQLIEWLRNDGISIELDRHGLNIKCLISRLSETTDKEKGLLIDLQIDERKTHKIMDNRGDRVK